MRGQPVASVGNFDRLPTRQSTTHCNWSSEDYRRWKMRQQVLAAIREDSWIDNPVVVGSNPTFFTPKGTEKLAQLVEH